MKSNTYIFSIILILITACNSSHIPKPRGYFRISTPEKDYIDMEKGYPFSFKYPIYAELNKYQGAQDKDEDVSNWLNLDFPALNAHLYLTFKPVENNLRTLIEDSHAFVYKHVGKADAIHQTEFISPETSVYGVLFDIKGNTASSLQFYVTDSISGFLRGALYFDCEPSVDSLAPLISFIRTDVEYLMETFSWQ